MLTRPIGWSRLLVAVLATSIVQPALAASRPTPTAAAIARAAQDPRLGFELAQQLSRAAAHETADAEPISLIVRGDIRNDQLAALGAEVGTHAGPVTTVFAPLSSVPALLDLTGVESIDVPRTLEPLLSLSASAIHAPSMWGGTPPNYTGVTGKRVIIGVIDTGLDLTHADFRTASNATRVKYVWDQTATGMGPAGGPCCGTEFTESQINAGSATEADANGHGTLITGIAASNGRATSGSFPAYRYVGIAPEADLVIVKSSLRETDIINGANYVFQKATSLGEDCVLLIAAGVNYGGHDGSYNLDAALSAMTGPGRIIVAAAGNQGGQAIHSRVNLSSGQTGSITFTIPTYTPNPVASEMLDVEGWHDASALFSVRLTSPTGITTGWIAPGTSSPTLDTPDGQLVVQNDITTNSKGGKRIWVRVMEAPSGSLPKTGTWTLDVQRQSAATTGVFNAWIAGWQFGSGNVSPVFTSNVDLTDLVMSPATADSVISVGAFTTRNSWTYVGGGSSFYTDMPPVNGLASFSSPGPRRDGVQRPDLTAPGQGVAASMSAQAAPGIMNVFKMDDGQHWIYRGTSAAAAHVAGAAALLLQQTPHMSPSAMRAAFLHRARADSYTGSVPCATWGAGKLDLLVTTLGVDGRPESLQMGSVYPNPTRGKLMFEFTVRPEDLRDGTHAVRLRILDLAGREVAVLHGHSVSGPQALTWNGLTSAGKPVPGGVYLGRLEIGTRTAVRRFVRLQ